MRPDSAAGLLAHQAGQDPGHLGRGCLPLAADEAIGAVFGSRQGGGLRVRGGLRQGVDRGAAHRMVRQRVRMHGDEQRRALLLRPLHPAIQRDEHVLGAGQLDPVAAAGFKLALEFQRGGQRDLLFIGAGDADGARVLAAVAGVQHDQRRRRSAALPSRGRRGCRAPDAPGGHWPPWRHAARAAGGRYRTPTCPPRNGAAAGDA